MANKAFRYRLKPNIAQEVLLRKTFGCCRFIYNKMLEDKIKYYNETKKSLMNTPAQYKKEFDFLKEVDSLALANEQIHLQTAYKNFFTNPKIGFPKYKSKKRDKKTYTTNHVSIVENHFVKLPKLGKVKFVEHRQIPQGYIVKSATIHLTPSGKYYISILTEYDENIPKIKLDKTSSIGLDYSSPLFYVDNKGKSPEYPKFFRQYEKKLAKIQRKLSLMKLHSKNYEKMRIKKAILEEKIANSRKDWIHNLSTKLANKYDYICLEDLNLQAMKSSLHLGKSTSDNGFGMFRTFLEYKMHDRGKKVVYIDKWFPSSKTCSVCGYINHELTLSVREWICPECGTHLDRDTNAAINILHQGLLLI